MLENGADIGFTQERPGHSDLFATRINALVGIGKHKEVHTQTHPGRLAKPGDWEASAEGRVAD